MSDALQAIGAILNLAIWIIGGWLMGRGVISEDYTMAIFGLLLLIGLEVSSIASRLRKS